MKRLNPVPTSTPTPAAPEAAPLLPAERMAALSTLFSPKETEQEVTKSSGGGRYLGFFSGKGDRAPDQIAALGDPALGCAYISEDGTYKNVHTVPWILLHQYSYWAVLSGENKKTWATEKPQKWGAVRPDGTKVKNCAIGLFLLLPEDAPAYTIVGDLLRDTKTGAIGDRNKAVTQTETPAWARANPSLAAYPPLMRVTSTWKAVTKPGGFGPWALLSSRSKPTTDGQAKQIAVWWEDADMQDEMVADKASFDDRVAAVRKIVQAS